MTRFLPAILLLLYAHSGITAQITFTGTGREVIEITPEANTGLDKIYVLYGTEGVAASYTAKNQAANVKWKSYRESGGGFAQDIAGTETDGINSVLPNVIPDCGYIIEDGAERFYFWVTDYEKHRLELNGISFPAEQDCGTATLSIQAQCDQIPYYTITGVPKHLDREIAIGYNTMAWDAENRCYQTTETTVSIDNISERTVLTAPLCSTTFTVSGDRFLREWGEELFLVSDTYLTKSIEVQATAEQTARENGNEQQTESESLGGSAPADIEFQAHCTEAVAHKEWQFATDPEFKNIILRLNEETVSYSFKENGSFYVKFIGSNDDASCQAESEIFEIAIGESVLECPNAFSPNATEGINDEWKVSYKSIVSFRCWIFDRYGNQMCSFSDPSLGWDGKHKGKFVRPGVYYYIIEAAGADGKEYKLKGDINILKSDK